MNSSRCNSFVAAKKHSRLERARGSQVSESLHVSVLTASIPGGNSSLLMCNIPSLDC